MRGLILLALLAGFNVLLAQTDPAFTSITINSSSTSLAMGNVTGVADVWSGDPLNIWSNPALVAFHDGIRAGYTHYKWKQGYDWGDITQYNSSSYASYGRNGWGYSVPMPNYNGKFGTTFDNGIYKYNGNSPKHHSYDTSGEISVAYNPMLRWKKNSKSLFIQSVDASLGFSLNVLQSRWEKYVVEEGNPHSYYLRKMNADSTPMNTGILLRFDGTRFFHLKNVELQASFGWESTNIINTQVQYDSTETYLNLPRDNRVGAGIFIGLPITLLVAEDTALSTYCAHVITVVLISGALESKFNHAENGQGIELGVFDMLYFRAGYHNVVDTDYEKTTTGAGIKLHYGKTWEAQYNYAQYANEIWRNQKSWDVAVAYKF